MSFGGNGGLCFPCIFGAMLYGSETWPVEEEDKTRLKMQGQLDRRGMLGMNIEDGFLQRNLRLNQNWITWGNVFVLED